MATAADTKRQIGIKTRSVKRLAGDVRSYIREKADHERAYASAAAAGSGVEAHDVRRAHDFVDEAEATLRDVRQRLQEAYVGLQRYLGELAVSPEHAALMDDQCITDARQMLADVAPLVSEQGVDVQAAVRAVRVAVLGDSSINEDDAIWRTCEQLGEVLARGGFHVVTGGYSGTSEAVSFGASRVGGAAAAAAAAGGLIQGVTCPTAFARTPREGAAGPNQYLTEQTPAGNLVERAGLLLRNTDAVVVLPGGLGTLSKLTMAWNLASVDAWASGVPARPVLAWKAPWQALLQSIGEQLHISDDLMQSIAFVESVDDIMAHLEPIKARAAEAAAQPSLAGQVNENLYS